MSAPEETRLPAARTFRERAEAIARACARLGRERAADAGGAVARAEELAP